MPIELYGRIAPGVAFLTSKSVFRYSRASKTARAVAAESRSIEGLVRQRGADGPLFLRFPRQPYGGQQSLIRRRVFLNQGPENAAGIC